MSRSAEQKIKLLILYDVLQKNTDENHPMTTKEIVSALDSYGIQVSRKTLYEDIDLLIRYGYDIVCVKGRNNQYFVGEHAFERPEIEVLLNVVSASKLLTQAKSSALSEKLAELLGKPQGEELKNTLTVTSNKSDNERIYYTIDAVTDALLQKRKFSFLYFDRALHGKKNYRKNGERYIVNPLGLIYSGDNFYLICSMINIRTLPTTALTKWTARRQKRKKSRNWSSTATLTLPPIAMSCFPCMRESGRKSSFRFRQKCSPPSSSGLATRSSPPQRKTVNVISASPSVSARHFSRGWQCMKAT